jgi:hypothetical protein
MCGTCCRLPTSSLLLSSVTSLMRCASPPESVEEEVDRLVGLLQHVTGA